MERNQPIIRTQSKHTEMSLLFAFSCLLSILRWASLAQGRNTDPGTGVCIDPRDSDLPRQHRWWERCGRSRASVHRCTALRTPLPSRNSGSGGGEGYANSSLQRAEISVTRETGSVHKSHSGQPKCNTEMEMFSRRKLCWSRKLYLDAQAKSQQGQ